MTTFVGQIAFHFSTFSKNFREWDLAGTKSPTATTKQQAGRSVLLAGMNNQLFVSKYQRQLPKTEEIQRFLEEKIKEDSP